VAIEALRKHRIRQDQAKQQAGTKWIEKGLVFPNTLGNFLGPNHLLTMFQRVLDQAGLSHMRFHDVRRFDDCKIALKGQKVRAITF
jgi:hypothetical protein